MASTYTILYHLSGGRSTSIFYTHFGERRRMRKPVRISPTGPRKLLWQVTILPNTLGKEESTER